MINSNRVPQSFSTALSYTRIFLGSQEFALHRLYDY